MYKPKDLALYGITLKKLYYAMLMQAQTCNTVNNVGTQKNDPTKF